ncbi:MAG TPA: PfkB family carbohydrate kinase [Azospirillum sp.]
MRNSRSRSAQSKIHTLEDLGRIAERAQAEGRTVALCHGVFDLVHLGHVRHIEQARSHGDVLIVTLTGDAHVNKGPGRPIFPERMRAEMLAAMECVDYVAINHAQSAEVVLDTVRPNVYVKGADYENPEEDVTGKITAERDCVERHGGRIVFTHDVTFSSSTLINRYLDVYDPPVRDFLDRLRGDGGLDALLGLIERIKDFRVLVVGDTIIDEYQYVNTLGKSAKENIIATQFKERELFIGGVCATANHVAGFCREVEVISTIGGTDSFEDEIRSHFKENVRATLIEVPGRPTTRKCRFVDPGYLRKLFEVYFMDDTPLPAEIQAGIDRTIAEKAAGFDLVIVNDFGHGLIAASTIAAIGRSARFVAVNAQSNAGNFGFNLITKYPKADYVCIDAPEARLAVGEKFTEISSVLGESLAGRIDCDRMVVTHGKHGCYAYARGKPIATVPAFTKTVVDTVGAGDAFFAVTAPLVAAGGDMPSVAAIGNAVGAIKVGIVGHRSSVEKVPLVKYLTALLK